MNIKDLVKDNRVNFLEYRQGILYYSVVYRTVQEEGMNKVINFKTYKFPVPIDDCGDATFPAEEKAIMFMRYIRKAMEEGTLVEVSGNE